MAGLVRWLLEAIDASDAHAYCLDRAYRRNIKEVVMKSEQVARLRKLVGSDAE